MLSQRSQPQDITGTTCPQLAQLVSPKGPQNLHKSDKWLRLVDDWLCETLTCCFQVTVCFGKRLSGPQPNHYWIRIRNLFWCCPKQLAFCSVLKVPFLINQHKRWWLPVSIFSVKANTATYGRLVWTGTLKQEFWSSSPPEESVCWTQVLLDIDHWWNLLWRVAFLWCCGSFRQVLEMSCWQWTGFGKRENFKSSLPRIFARKFAFWVQMSAFFVWWIKLKLGHWYGSEGQLLPRPPNSESAGASFLFSSRGGRWSSCVFVCCLAMDWRQKITQLVNFCFNFKTAGQWEETEFLLSQPVVLLSEDVFCTRELNLFHLNLSN